MNRDRHFTVSVYVVNNNSVLLHKHKKAQILLPVGGHIDLNELPEEAAVREVFEEAGVEVELYNIDSLKGQNVNTEREKMLINPVHMVWAEVGEKHEHIDFVFYARSISERLKPGENESRDLRWYAESELDCIKDELLKDVYLMAKEAIRTYKANEI